MRCKTNSKLTPEVEGVIKWAKYKAGYTLQDEHQRTLAGFRGEFWLPEIKEMLDGRIDGVISKA